MINSYYIYLGVLETKAHICLLSLQSFLKSLLNQIPLLFPILYFVYITSFPTFDKNSSIRPSNIYLLLLYKEKLDNLHLEILFFNLETHEIIKILHRNPYVMAPILSHQSQKSMLTSPSFLFINSSIYQYLIYFIIVTLSIVKVKNEFLNAKSAWIFINTE